jgi:hypothetical protein
MVNHIKTVEDHDERNRLAKAIIQIMGSMNPHLRDVADFKHKLWDHLAIIADFDLEVESPYPVPQREILNQKPERMGYQQSRDIKFKHYGRVLENMIKRAVTYPEGEEKAYLIEVILNQMKKSFLTWNRESVSDDMIMDDLKFLSDNQLEIPAGIKLKEIKDLISRPAPTNNPRRTQQAKRSSNNNPRRRK